MSGGVGVVWDWTRGDSQANLGTYMKSANRHEIYQVYYNSIYIYYYWMATQKDPKVRCNNDKTLSQVQRSNYYIVVNKDECTLVPHGCSKHGTICVEK